MKRLASEGGKGGNQFTSFVMESFFDKDKVIRALDKGRASALRKCGGYVMRTARRSIKKPRMGVSDYHMRRYRRAISRAQKKGEPIRSPQPMKRPLPGLPGEPPRNKSDLLKKSILFGYDTHTFSAIVGPIKLYTGTADVLEYGGDAILPGDRGAMVRMRFKGNPFMAPALQVAADKGKIAEAFKSIL